MSLSNSETSSKTGAVAMFQNSLNNIKNCSLVADIPRLKAADLNV